MPVSVSTVINSNCLLGIWKVQESREELLAALSLNEATVYGSEINELRKLHRLCSRALLRALTGDHTLLIDYDQYKSPFILNSSWNISISHAYEYVAVILHKTAKTGIDIELIKPKIERIASKFMHEEELTAVPEKCRKEQLYVYWCAKEALYKLYGKKNLLFKEHISIAPFDYRKEGYLSGKIKTSSLSSSFTLKYEKIGDYMLVYVLNP